MKQIEKIDDSSAEISERQLDAKYRGQPNLVHGKFGNAVDNAKLIEEADVSDAENVREKSDDESNDEGDGQESLGSDDELNFVRRCCGGGVSAIRLGGAPRDETQRSSGHAKAAPGRLEGRDRHARV